MSRSCVPAGICGVPSVRCPWHPVSFGEFAHLNVGATWSWSPQGRLICSYLTIVRS